MVTEMAMMKFVVVVKRFTISMKEIKRKRSAHYIVTKSSAASLLSRAFVVSAKESPRDDASAACFSIILSSSSFTCWLEASA